MEPCAKVLSSFCQFGQFGQFGQFCQFGQFGQLKLAEMIPLAHRRKRRIGMIFIDIDIDIDIDALARRSTRTGTPGSAPSRPSPLSCYRRYAIDPAR